jgi:hypothetical protein
MAGEIGVRIRAGIIETFWCHASGVDLISAGDCHIRRHD